MQTKLKLIMYHGRAAGHNILPFLEYLDSRKDIETKFCYSKDKTFKETNSNLSFHKVEYRKTGQIRNILKWNADVIWFHGGHSLPMFLLFSLFRPKKSIYIFNVWNEWILRKALRPNITGRLYRWAIKKADVVHCNWHGTANFVLENQLHSNVKVYYWGLHPDYFSNEEPKISPVTSTFLTTLEEDKTFFFFPKSISVNSRHDLVIEACKILSEKGIRDFRVIFWPGNTTNPEVLARLEQLISSYQLEHTVTIYHHDFVPFSDMKVIWNQMDCGLQIADNEQLSTTFTEPQFFKKEIIVTDIEPYRIYNEKFESKIPLISMDSDALALRMQEIIGGKKTESSLIKHRSAVIHKHFNIMKNIDRIVQIYEDQVNRFSKEDKVF